MENIITLAKALEEKREQVNVSTEYLAGLKADKDEIQSKLIEALKEAGLKSIKTNEANYALTIKKDIKVYDEAPVLEYLKAHGAYDDYVSPKLDTIRFKSYAKSLLNAEGEIIDGTELTETEYISIKQATNHTA